MNDNEARKLAVLGIMYAVIGAWSTLMLVYAVVLGRKDSSIKMARWQRVWINTSLSISALCGLMDGALFMYLAAFLPQDPLGLEHWLRAIDFEDAVFFGVLNAGLVSGVLLGGVVGIRPRSIIWPFRLLEYFWRVKCLRGRDGEKGT